MGGRCREGSTAAGRSSMSKQRVIVQPGGMPSEAEVEEFFASMEGGVSVQHFNDKYNYDFVRDEPMEGRYEWVALKAEQTSARENQQDDDDFTRRKTS